MDKVINKAEEFNLNDELITVILEEQQREFEERSKIAEVKRDMK